MPDGVTTLTLSDGTFCLVEPEQRPGLDRRVFAEHDGGYVWAHYADVQQHGKRARWYGWHSRELPATMTCP